MSKLYYYLTKEFDINWRSFDRKYISNTLDEREPNKALLNIYVKQNAKPKKC